MLGLLFGNKTIEKILFFLFVNGKCYGTYIHRFLGIPLNPIQKALLKLEKIGIVVSRYEGKTRVYEFNPYFPLASEIENLVKKSYFFLSSEERNSLYACDSSGSRIVKNNGVVLFNFRNCLLQTKSLIVSVRSKIKDETDVGRSGRCDVVIEKEADGSLIFIEKGSWMNSEPGKGNFTNVFRWIFHNNDAVGVEHLRYGREHPVFLFYLIPISQNTLSSGNSFLNDKGIVFGHIRFDENKFSFHRRIISPDKDEKIEYFYS